MEKVENKNNMTVVYLAPGANKPVAPFTGHQIFNNKKLDPSSSLRSDRYPLPTSSYYEYRSGFFERDLAF
jgi:hypothetical protein